MYGLKIMLRRSSNDLSVRIKIPIENIVLVFSNI